MRSSLAWCFLVVYCATAIASSFGLPVAAPIWNVSYTTQTVAYYPTSTPLLLWGSRLIVGGGAPDGTSALLCFRFDASWLAPPELQWTYAVPNTSAPTFSTPVLSLRGDRVYFGGNDNCVHAVDATTGTRLWRLCPSSSSSNSSLVASSLVARTEPFAGGEGEYMVSCTRLDGSTAAESLLCGSTNGYLYALRAADTSNPTVSWTINAGGKVYANAIAATVGNDTLVFLASTEGTMRALDAASGAVRWAVNCGAELDATPVVSVTRPGGPLASEQEVCFGADSGVFSCLDAGSGRLLWSVSLNSSIKTRPVVVLDAAGSRFVLATMGGALICVAPPAVPPGPYSSTPSTGSIIWSVPTPGPVFTSPADITTSSGNSRIAASTFNGQLVVVDADGGSVVWRGATPTGGAVASRFGSVACASNGLSEQCVLLVTSWDKNLWAFAL